MNQPEDNTHDVDGLDVPDVFTQHRCTPEAVYPVPALTDTDPTLEIRIAAAGGGTLGRRYTDTTWYYQVLLDGAVVSSGSDLRSGGIPHGHRYMAGVLAEFLSTPTPAPRLLHPHADRLAIWAHDATGTDAR